MNFVQVIKDFVGQLKSTCGKIFTSLVTLYYIYVTDPPKSSAFSPWPVKRDESSLHQPDSHNTNDVTDDIAERSDDEEEEEDEDLDEDDDEVRHQN